MGGGGEERGGKYLYYSTFILKLFFSLIIFKETMFIFAAITTIKQSNLHPCQVISKLPSTSTVQAASENKQKFPLFTEKRGDCMKLFRHMYILTMYILQYRMGMFSLGLSVVGAVKKKKQKGGGEKTTRG